MSAVQPAVERVAGPALLRAFVDFPRRVYRGDRLWVPPPPGEVERRLDPRRNPLWAHAERELFIARAGSSVLGTVAAIADTSAGGVPAGRFGFWETVDDQRVAAALLDAAAAWLRERGCAVMRGPYNGATTDEAGVLVDGFATRPAMWEARTPPYYQRLLECLGFRGYDDGLAYEVALRGRQADDVVLPRLEALAGRARRGARLHLRELRLDDWDNEVALICDLYNRAFEDTPGHAPISAPRFADLARRLRPLLDPATLLLAEHSGEPAGFMVGLRDYNPALAALGGRGDPLALLRFRWRLARTRTLCVKMLGVVPELRGRGVDALLMDGLARRARARGYTVCELSLISARNLRVRRIAERAGARIVRRYTIYERPT